MKQAVSMKGIAGRCLSLITALKLEPAKRSYAGVCDYCTRCGACAENCPAGAISLEKGKSHVFAQILWRKTGQSTLPVMGAENVR